MSFCRVCMADIEWCETEEGEKVPLDLHEPAMEGEGRYRIKTAGTGPSGLALIESLAVDFPEPGMVDHRKICQQPRVL
jgi:hypothetical protein